MIPKFRLWHKSSKKMLFVDNVNNLYWAYFEDFGNKPFYTCIERIPDSKGKREYDLNTIHVDFDEGILMQSTGLFDKNGVEVFEGDVVKFQCTMTEHGTDESELMVVKRNTVIDASKWEVIGNRWENPELVEVKNEP